MELIRPHNSSFSFSKSFARPILLAFSLLVFLFSFGFFFYRTQFGVDFMDEAYYSGLALRLYLGQKLFVDELYLAQTFAVLSYPFFKLYMLLNHSMEGIILFMRNINALLYLGLSAVLYRSLRKKIDLPIAILISATACLYFPGNIETLSYNTLGTLFLSLGLIALFNAFENEKPIFSFIAGVCLGLASLSYVTFLAFTGFTFIYLFFLSPTRKYSFSFALGAALPISLMMFFILFHLSDFLASMGFSKEYNYTARTLLGYLSILHKFTPKTVIATGIVFVSLARYLSLKKSPSFFWLLGSVPFIAVLFCEFSYAHWSGYPFYLSALSLISFFQIRPEGTTRNLLKWIFIPSLIAGLVSSLTSASGYLNAQVGAIPASFVGLFFLAQALKETSIKTDSLIKQLAIPVSLAAPVFLIFLYPLNIWNDSDFSQLTEKITVGPWKGIHTAPEKKKIAEQTYLELKPLLNIKGPLLIYPNFCTGYLVAPVPPAKGVIWYANSGRVNEILAGLYQSQINPESRVIRMKVWYGTPTVKAIHSFDLNDPLNRLIETTHHPIKDTEWFTVFAPNRK